MMENGNRDTEANGLQYISISKLKEYGFKEVFCFKDKLIVSDRIDHLNIFKDPCRIDGIVLFLCMSGEIDCSINLKKYHITAGTLLVNFTSDIIQVEHTTGFEGYAGLVSYDYLESLQIDFYRRLTFYLGVKNNAIAQIDATDVSAIEMYFQLLKKNILDNREDSSDIINRIIQALGLSVISITSLAKRTDTDSTPEEVKARPIRAEQIFERFMSNLSHSRAQIRSVRHYANELGLTPNYLSNVVRSFSGKSAIEWINEYAMMEAKVLLRYSDMNIQEIAYHLNFTTQSAFGKYFKQYTGLSPKAYRNNCK